MCVTILAQDVFPLEQEAVRFHREAKRAVEVLDARTPSTDREIQSIANLRHNLQGYYEAYDAILNPEPPSTHAPWKEEFVLWEMTREHDMDNFGLNSIEGNTLCILRNNADTNNLERQGWRAGTLTPVLADLTTLEKTELASWYYVDKEHGNIKNKQSCHRKIVALLIPYLRLK